MNTRTVSNRRIAWIDIAKCFGIFFVVLGHSFDEVNLLQQILYIFHVPFFFFLSGLTYHYNKDQMAFFIKKVKQLYIPYILVALVSIVVYLLMGSLVGQDVGFNMPSISACLFGMIYGNVSVGNMMWNRPLWFLPALFVVLVLTNLLEAIKNKPVRYTAVVLLSACGYFLSARRIFLPLQAESALSMLVWIYAGMLLKKPLIRMENTPRIKLALYTIPLWIIGFGVGFYNGTISVMVDLYGKNVFLYMIAVLALSIAMIFVCMIIRKNRTLEYIGRNTLVILLWHKFPIEFFQGICPGVKNWLVSPNVWVMDSTAVVVSIISIYLSILLKVIYNYCLKMIRKEEVLIEDAKSGHEPKQLKK